MRRNPQAGFSLVELMVAMVVTLIVTGSIFGLLSGGQSSFKVQPERTDRQQNIRVAMDIIIRDISAAGVSMPAFVQTFTGGLNAAAGAPVGSSGVATDEIEIVTNTAGFDNMPTCDNAGNGTIPTLIGAGGAPPVGTAVIALMSNNSWNLRRVTARAANAGALGANCIAGAHVDLTLSSDSCTAGPAPGTAPGVAPCRVSAISFANVVRYRIRNDALNVPNLERIANGGAAQVLARGIEDLQFQYVQSGAACTLAAPCDNAPAVTDNDYTTLITQVRVTMSARSTAPGLIQGATRAVSGPDAIRGSLTSEISPRTALWVLTQETLPVGTPPKWN